ncbi:Na+/H+ antiporter [Nocardioides eburneiflavus]|uniref:Na+/H+ antiporter n=1 Tax=Nocardioides eburneiflavus TaxID=2518372 RepID=A0A4Z1C2Z0_9ACTN|nr:Na+/H+ antiporter [Nocardioides eburneiflavus]TGN63272.1 Na+/H+ antiporter [Nocardioides eburneiflavus]
MEIALLLVSMAAVVLAVAAVSERVHVPAPLLLVVVGGAASYLPGLPTIHLESEVVLLGLLPPLLYAAAIQTSLVDFNANRGSILRLSVLLVVLTALAVGAVAQWLVPGLGWAAAIAIGAVVAPPDAVAATAVARRIGLPRRVVTILEGESLLNDATALVTLRTAIAFLAGSLTVAEVGLDFVRAAGGGALIGFAAFWVVARLRRRITDPLMDTGISFLTPFAAYVAAEEVHASGVISVVVAGLLLGHKAPIIQTAQSRITERITWGTVAFLLENTVFLLIGLQLDWILEDVTESTLSPARIALVCVAVLLTVVVVRLGWVFSTLLFRRMGDNPLPASWTFLVGWAGMRGVVTLAAAFVIPEDTPHREVLLLVAFTVVAGTLLVQGLTLPLLKRTLGVPSPDPAEDALSRAALLQWAADAGVRRLDELEYEDHHGVVDQIRGRLDQRSFAAWEQLATTTGEETPSELYARIRGEMIDAERAKVLKVRSEGRVASDVVRQVLGLLDIEESMLDAGTSAREGVRDGTLAFTAGIVCEDLETHPAVETVADPACATCLADGTPWVSLRECLTCGHVGCCDSSIGRHATGHFHESLHPVVESADAGESWRWCYVHSLTG